MKSYKCIKTWARDNEGDIIPHHIWKRYEKTIRDNNFVEYVKKTKSVSVEKSKDTFTKTIKKEKGNKTVTKTVVRNTFSSGSKN